MSTQWVVGDDAAHVVTVRFHQHLRSGESPARALARAQSWVRTATNADVMAELGPDYRPPDGLPAAALSDPGWQSQRPFVEPVLWDEVEGFAIYHFSGQDLCSAGRSKVNFSAKHK